jgi:hypothetical protein
LLIQATGLLVKQLVFHSQFTYLGLQPLNQAIFWVLLSPMGLEGRGSRRHKLLSPLADGSGSNAEFSAEGFEVLSAKQADDGLRFALGREPACWAKAR